MHESPKFEGVTRTVDVDIGRLHINWNSISMNRVLRFFKYNRHPEKVIE